MNFQNFKCRCSGIHKIMANSRSNPQLTEKQAEELDKLENSEALLTPKQIARMEELWAKRANNTKIVLGDTCIEYLTEVYAWEKWGMVGVKKEMEEIDYMEKGKMVEEDCITLLSVIDGVIYEKNDERVENEYLSGEPDVYLGPEIMHSEKITDIKASFDLPTFLKKIHKGLENGWEEQVQGYGDITGASDLSISHCLVSMPLIMQGDFKKRLFYKGNWVTEESPGFQNEWKLIEHSMNFDIIPKEQRVFKVKVEPFSQFQKQQVYDRVKVCREWLVKFDEMIQKLNIATENLVDSEK